MNDEARSATLRSAGRLAQLARAPRLHRGGRGFEPLTAYHRIDAGAFAPTGPLLGPHFQRAPVKDDADIIRPAVCVRPRDQLLRDLLDIAVTHKHGYLRLFDCAV